MQQNLTNHCPFPVNYPILISGEQTHTCLSLYKLVNQVINCLAAQPIELITNNVPQGLLVSTDRVTLGTVLTSLLNTVLINGKDNTIQLSAKMIGSITVMHIKTSDTGQTDAISETFKKLQPVVQSIGGCATISSSKFHGIDLAFTFINH